MSCGGMVICCKIIINGNLCQTHLFRTKKGDQSVFVLWIWLLWNIPPLARLRFSIPFHESSSNVIYNRSLPFDNSTASYNSALFVPAHYHHLLHNTQILHSFIRSHLPFGHGAVAAAASTKIIQGAL